MFTKWQKYEIIDKNQEDISYGYQGRFNQKFRME